MNYSLISIIIKIHSKLSKSNRRIFCKILKKINLPLGENYKKLRFVGEFEVYLENNKIKFANFEGEIENEIFWKGLFNTWESEAGWIWMELCKTSQTIFDIGANNGIYSLTAFCLNPKAEIYAFEPSIYTFEKLKKNVLNNNYSIICEPLAISNITDKQIFYDLPYNNQTGASLSADMMKNNFKPTIEYLVKTITLKEYIKINQIKSINLIKLDVELHEAKALEGLGDYLINYKPIIILEMLTQKVADDLSLNIDLNEFNLFHLGNGKVSQLYEFKILKESLSRGDWNYLIFHKSMENYIKTKTTLYNKIF